MDKYLNRTQSTCFAQLRIRGSLPLMSIEQNIDAYKNLYNKNPIFGMDIYSNDFKAKDFVILQHIGKGNKPIPICCSHYILILNIKGKSLRYVNQYTYKINKHSVQLLAPGLIYSFEDLSNDCESIMIFFEYSFLSSSNIELLEFFSRKFEAQDLNQEVYIEVLKLFKLLNIEYKNKKLDYKEYSKTLLQQILYLIKREKSIPIIKKIDTRSEQISKQFLTLIEENFQMKKSVKEYADVLGITPKHLSETIKETQNVSALFLIHSRIIKEIQYQLSYTSLSIKEISSSLYFTNSSDFGRFFKRYKELSPKLYRLKFQV